MENECGPTTFLDLAQSWPGLVGLVVLCGTFCFVIWVSAR